MKHIDPYYGAKTFICILDLRTNIKIERELTKEEVNEWINRVSVWPIMISNIKIFMIRRLRDIGPPEHHPDGWVKNSE